MFVVIDENSSVPEPAKRNDGNGIYLIFFRERERERMREFVSFFVFFISMSVCVCVCVEVGESPMAKSSAPVPAIQTNKAVAPIGLS